VGDHANSRREGAAHTSGQLQDSLEHRPRRTAPHRTAPHRTASHRAEPRRARRQERRRPRENAMPACDQPAETDQAASDGLLTVQCSHHCRLFILFLWISEKKRSASVQRPACYGLHTPYVRRRRSFATYRSGLSSLIRHDCRCIDTSMSFNLRQHISRRWWLDGRSSNHRRGPRCRTIPAGRSPTVYRRTPWPPAVTGARPRSPVVTAERRLFVLGARPGGISRTSMWVVVSTRFA
jgi:hypothetical protein